MRTRIAFWSIVLPAVNVASVVAEAQVPSAPVEVRVPYVPILVTGADGAAHLAYELHVTNVHASTGILSLDRLEVFGGRDASALVTYGVAELDERVMHADAERETRLRHSRAVESGRRAVAHVWVTAPTTEAERLRDLTHRLVFIDDKGREQLVDDVPLHVGRRAPPVLAAPLRGGLWLVHNGPGNHLSPHWGSVVAWNGRTTVPQRFAVDFIGLDENGGAVRGDFRTSANQDWVGFGAEVVAVADGVVREMQDGVIDHAPLVEPDPPAVLTAAALYGNHVVLDLGSNTFVHYAHLQRNSVTVNVGQRVRRGQVLGRLGNSGNTNAPHLHFHVSDSASFGGSEGDPFVIDSFDLIGETTAERAITEGAALDVSPTPKRSRHRQLPLDGMIVRFP